MQIGESLSQRLPLTGGPHSKTPKLETMLTPSKSLTCYDRSLTTSTALLGTWQTLLRREEPESSFDYLAFSTLADMHSIAYKLNSPNLEEAQDLLRPAIAANYSHSSVEVVQCPDLRASPFNLAAEGLSGTPVVADVGGQPNLFPRPRFDKKYSLIDIARDCMQMSRKSGMLIGAGAGPFHVIGQNSELAPNIAWTDGHENHMNLTHYTKVDKSRGRDSVVCQTCPSTDCALMVNLFGSSGLPGPVIKITARKRTGMTKSFTDVIRFALHEHFGEDRPVSLGGVFVIRKGKANFHVMPDFPPDNELPFDRREQLNDWLTYHDFAVQGNGNGDEIVCLSVLHSADPDKKMGLRMEHTHCFSRNGHGGHYHYDVEDEEIEYEGYFNIAETIYRVDRPEVSLQKDLHD